VALLGPSQLVCWGVSYYLIGILGEAIARDMAWASAVVFGGFSWALVVMGALSGVVGRAIDRFGGRPVMAAGSILTAAGCAALAAAESWAVYYLAWTVLGAAMRLTLYDAAFATLTRILGANARRPISHITLLGGLASSVFWPIGLLFLEWWGWRGAALAYAAIALVVTLPLHVLLPRVSSPAVSTTGSLTKPEPHPRNAPIEYLFAAIVAMVGFLASAMSAHMVTIMAAFGIAASAAVAVAALRGVAQTAARLAEIVFGARLSPVALGLVATAFLPASFVAAGLTGVSIVFGAGFALLYGAGNGLATIVRGTLPLALFGSTG
jgi:MFS family permease